MNTTPILNKLKAISKKNPPSEYQEKVIQVAATKSREEIHELLDQAIDDNNVDQVNFYLDVIESDEKYIKFIMSLPSSVATGLVEELGLGKEKN